MSFDSLRIGASGLHAAQRAVELASNNVSNVNTPGYTRQRAELANAFPTPGVPGVRGDGMRSNGVVVAGLTRLRDQLADLAWRDQASTTGYHAARADVLQRAERTLGDIGSGMPKALNDFWSSWQNLSLSPTDPGAREAVLYAGRDVAGQLRAVTQDLEAIEPDIRTQVDELGQEVNALLKHVANLNKSIAEAVVGQQLPSDLYDERDRAVDRLAELAGVTTRETTLGRIDVYLGNEAVVREESAQQISTTLPPAPVAVLLPNGAEAKVGGELGGYIQAITVTIPSFRAELDTIAAGVIAAVNTAHQAGYDISNGLNAPGDPGIAFFTGTGAGDIAVNAAMTRDRVAASASGSPNDGNNALVLANIRTQATVGTATANAAVNAFAGRLGQEVLNARRDSSTAATVLGGVDLRRAESNSVNIDEEMVDLVRYQRAYQASARVVSVTDGMLDTIINRMAV